MPNVCGVIRTTVYLPEELKRRLERTARDRRVSQAKVIRTALDEYTAKVVRRPRLPLLRGEGETNIAERAEEILADNLGRI
jgi:hypothetical protein